MSSTLSVVLLSVFLERLHLTKIPPHVLCNSKFLLGTSTGSALVAEDNSQLTAMDSADSLIAASAAALDKTGWSTNSLIYGRHKVQTRKLQDNAGLDWIVVLVQPIECDSNAFYNYTKQACVECPFMMSVNVDPATSALMPCVCDAGVYSAAFHALA